jgi:aminoglycoside/choline kinase family phosphotransferase
MGRALWFRGFPLPRIYDWDLKEGFFLLEDLGEGRLAEIVGASPAEIPVLYPKAISLLARLHEKGLEALGPAITSLNPPYDARFAREREWEYFLKALKIARKPIPLPPGLQAEGELLTSMASATDRPVFIHRDFQSRNLIARDGEIYLIDWQGGRRGPALYDLASFLLDPYVSLNDAEIALFFRAYAEERSLPLEESRERFIAVAVARLLQTVGAYAFLSAERGLAGYRAFIPKALKRILATLDKTPRSADFKLLRAVTRQFLDNLEEESPCAP